MQREIYNLHQCVCNIVLSVVQRCALYLQDRENLALLRLVKKIPLMSMEPGLHLVSEVYGDL